MFQGEEAACVRSRAGEASLLRELEDSGSQRATGELGEPSRERGRPGWGAHEVQAWGTELRWAEAVMGGVVDTEVGHRCTCLWKSRGLNFEAPGTLV